MMNYCCAPYHKPILLVNRPKDEHVRLGLLRLISYGGYKTNTKNRFDVSFHSPQRVYVGYLYCEPSCRPSMRQFVCLPQIDYTLCIEGIQSAPLKATG